MDRTSARDVRSAPLGGLPSVDRLLQHPGIGAEIERHGRQAVLRAVRDALSGARNALREGAGELPTETGIVRAVAERLAREARPELRRVFNLTGTVLHTNLGRAPLPEEA